MKRPPHPDEDHLAWIALTDLRDFAIETRLRGHAVGKVSYVAGDARWTFPLAFDDFLAAGHSMVGAERSQWLRAMQTMGPTMTFLGLDLAVTACDHPELLPERRQTWEDTLFDLLRSKRPRVVVIVDLFMLWPSEIGGWPLEPPAIVAIGLHPTRIVGYACAHRAGEPRGMSFGPPIALGARLAHALGERRYLAVFGPERT